MLFMFVVLEGIAFAHGEDKPGPHGGYITMPGPFHVEVVPEPGKNIKIYLLDLKFKNPLTVHSSVKATLQNQDKLELKCEKEKTFFSCGLKKGMSLSKGKIIVEASRNGVKGSPAEYHLPLSFAKKANPHH